MQALLFDCDGVLVDTEADGHRVSFNRAFGEKGKLVRQYTFGFLALACLVVLLVTDRDRYLCWRDEGLADTWDVPLYGELLEIGGGKERMTKYFKVSRTSSLGEHLVVFEHSKASLI